MNEPTTWQGRVVAEPAHAQDLEVAAGVKQFSEGLPQSQAEDAAYSEYVRSRALDAAAHHLAGIRAAHAAGFSDVAAEHAQAYAQAAERAGFEPNAVPPKEVLDRLAGMSPIHRFKRHPADAIWAPPEDGQGL